MTGKVGVAISSYRRPEVLAKSLAGWAVHLDSADELVVNHDHHGAGVSATKNRGITALMDLGCEHLFIADSDMHPVSPNWWRPYVDNRQSHLVHCWGKSRYIGIDSDVTVWSWPRGVLMYLERQVVERVGGMRVDFDVGHIGGEHVEYSRRIFNCGFTSHPFQDAAAARRGVWWCADYERSVPSTLPASRYTNPELAARRHELFDRYRHSTEHVEYRR